MLSRGLNWIFMFANPGDNCLLSLFHCLLISVYWPTGGCHLADALEDPLHLLQAALKGASRAT
jgi:hypothetical protein